jgi:hypothetical protein
VTVGVPEPWLNTMDPCPWSATPPRADVAGYAHSWCGVSLLGHPFLKQPIQFSSMQGIDFQESACDKFKSDSVYPKESAHLLHDGRIVNSETAGNFKG